jgi:osmoprotectant transport system substrate-binding protein
MKKLLIFVLCAAVAATLLLGGCATKKTGADSIVILGGDFAEPQVLAHMARFLLEEHTDLKVVVHDPMATVPKYNALKSGQVDITVSYDGTLLTTFLGYDPSDVPAGESLYDWVNERGREDDGVELLDKLGLDNTYALAVKQELADQYNLRTISDLIPHAGDLIFGTEHEFFDEEGTIRYGPFTQTYGLDFKDGISLDMTLKYSAIDSGNVDVTMVYATDGLNKKFGLFILEDDKSFFPEYNGAFLVKTSIYEKYAETCPELKDVLNRLGGQFDNVTMTDLSYQVDVDGREPADVAMDFLKSRGLV